MSEMTGDFAKYTVPFALGSLESILGPEGNQRWLLGEVIALGYDPRLHAYYDHYMIHTYGQLRGRPAWAERIGKKYQRIALARLVGRLDDVARANGVEAEGLAGRELRQLDPSLLARGIEAVPTEKRIATWWAPSAMDFGSTAHLSDIDWVACDDFPDPPSFVQEVSDPTRPEQRWRLLDAFFDWENKEPGDRASRYRLVRMRVNGYFIAKDLLSECVEELAKADLFGCSLPKGFDTDSHAYVGEYPWAPAFPEMRERPDTWEVDSTPFARFDLQPLGNRFITLADSTMVDSLALRVPAAPLALAALARWNGEAGFRLENGREVFKDPSFGALGPSALMGDVPTLERLLEEKDAAIVWTVVAERFIVGDYGNKDFCGRRHISAVVWMEDNEVRVRRAVGEYLRPDRTRV